MKKNWIDFSVGLFVAIALFAFGFLAVNVGGLGISAWKRSYQVSILFDNIGNLNRRASIRSAGVVVGRVHSVHFDNSTYQARVLVDIDKKYRFPLDSVAKIQTSGLLGEQYINLDPGSDEAMLEAGGTIEMTQSALVLENMIGQFLYSKPISPGEDSNPLSIHSILPRK